MKKIILKRVTALLLAVLLCAALLPDFSMNVHAATQSQKNIVARADWYYGITWVARESVAGWGGTFAKGSTYHIPYGQPVSSGKYIGYDVSFEDFLNAASTAGSVFYTGRSYDTDESAPYYASDCSAFVSWCWNISRTATNAINSVSTSHGAVTVERATTALQLGDALNYAGNHVVLVTGLEYDASGAITTIEITEQTTPQMKRTLYTPAALAQKYSNFTIQRYTGTVPAAPAELPCHEEESWIEKACFDVMVYRDRNTDLSKMTDAQLKEHWLTYGIKEGRPSSTILDLGYYLEQNSDLRDAFGDDFEAIYYHFITSGYRERRKSSLLFDGDYYVQHNADVYKAMGEDYLQHYIAAGMKEGRRASKTYSPHYYLSVRPDVAETWPNDYVMAARHYAGHGINANVVAYDSQLPVITDAKITNVTKAGYTVTCKATDNVGVSFVAFPTWTLLNDQDDLFKDWGSTQRGTKDGDTYTFQVKASDHNNEGGFYVTHIYAFDAEGNKSSLNLNVLELKDPSPDDEVPDVDVPDVDVPDVDVPDVDVPDDDVPDVDVPDDDVPDVDVPGDNVPDDGEEEVPEEKLTLLTTSVYKLEGKFLKNVKPSTPARSLLRQFTNETLKLLDKDGNEITGFNQVGTGVTVNLYDADGQLLDSATVVVCGDVDGNSKVDTTDYLRIKAAFLSELPLNNVEKAAADVDGNGTIDTTDYLRIKAHFLDKFDLNA